jgi:hydrogenase expression/formation protein HypC
MCLAIPLRITELLPGGFAMADSGGAKLRISLALIDKQLATGDLVLVHAGFAIEVVDEDEAAEVRALIAEILAPRTDLSAEPEGG